MSQDLFDQLANLPGMQELMNAEDELSGFVPDADANAFSAPVPDGKYVGIVRPMFLEEPEKWFEKKLTKADNDLYFNVPVKVTLVQTPGGEYDNREVNMMNCMTLVGARGTCGVQGLIQALGYGDAILTTRSHQALVKVLLSIIGTGEHLVGIETAWQASIYDKDKAETVFGPVRGMRNFPKDSAGNHIPEIQDPKTLQVARAYPEIRRWLTPESVADEQGEPEVPAQAQAPVQAAQSAPKPNAAPAPRPQAPVAPQPTQAAPQQAQAPAQQGPPVPARAAQPRPRVAQPAAR